MLKVTIKNAEGQEILSKEESRKLHFSVNELMKREIVL